jgi:tetratricopeptide (TPR) repeat protein
MASTDVPPPPAAPPAARVRRRWLRLLLAAGVLLAGALLACGGWAAWQEHSARRALAEERFDEAQRHVDLALRLRPGSVSTNVLAARIARLRGAYAEAERHLTRGTQAQGMSEPLQLEWLLLRCERGEVDELAPELLAWVERNHPQSPAILEALARVYMRQTRYLEALRCLDRWVELAPDSARALDWRGWVNNQLDHNGQAITDHKRVLELQPGRPGIRFRLADILVESSRHAEAVPYLEQLHREQPDNPEVLVDLARCRIVQTRLDEARALLDSVLEAHPGHFEALLRRGEVELTARRYRQAERWLRQAVARRPWVPEARYSLHRSLQLQPDRQKEAREELARWQRARKRRDRLVRLLRTELDRKPNDPDLAAEAGELFLQVGEEGKGLFWLHRALAINPEHAPSHRALLAYYERTNNPANAAEHRRHLTPGRQGAREERRQKAE